MKIKFVLLTAMLLPFNIFAAQRWTEHKYVGSWGIAKTFSLPAASTTIVFQDQAANNPKKAVKYKALTAPNNHFYNLQTTSSLAKNSYLSEFLSLSTDKKAPPETMILTFYNSLADLKARKNPISIDRSLIRDFGNAPAVEQPVKRFSGQSKQAIKRLGVFTNMRLTAEHQYGLSVELWQEKDRIFGLFLSSAGLIGDTPTGLLEDVSFDPATKRLAFRARLSTAVTFDQNNREIPTRDVFEFKGVLKNRNLTGILVHRDDSTGSATVSKKKISLGLSKSQTAAMSQPPSYEEWKKSADEILALRGPKW